MLADSRSIDQVLLLNTSFQNCFTKAITNYRIVNRLACNGRDITPIVRREFDAQKYLQETGREKFVLAETAMKEGRYGKAAELYQEEYDSGNIMAGVRHAVMQVFGMVNGYSLADAVSLIREGIDNDNPIAAELHLRICFSNCISSEDKSDGKKLAERFFLKNSARI